jgi:ribonuclease Z
MKTLFLGTSGTQPTRERNPSAILVRHKSENILIDCGEGTQIQLWKAGLSPTKITKILISHWHGDHVLGIPGLIMTLGNLEYSKTLEIYGPEGTKKFMRNLSKSFIIKDKIKIKIKEIQKQGKFLETKDLIFSSIKLNHTSVCLGYIIKEKDRRKMNLKYLRKFNLTKHPILKKLQEGKNISYNGKKILAKNATNLVPGKKISVIVDTLYSTRISKAVKNSDLLIIESTFLSNLKERAKETKHLTAEQAAKISKQANVKKLILTHLGIRYKCPAPLLKEARTIFKNTKIAKDLMEIKL